MAGRLRIGVYNRFWPTAGGGEKFAGGIAEALAVRHDVDVIGHDDTDPAKLAELATRLGLDLTGVGWRAVDPSPSAVEAASADYDLFVNASYGSVLRNRARHGLYVTHFPTIGAPPPTGWRRFARRVAGRLARWTGADPEGARWAGGAYSPEPLGPLTHRWTDGEAVLQLGAAPARRRGPGRRRQARGRPVTLVLGRVTADAGPVEVTLRDDTGAALATTTVTPRRRRASSPLWLLRARVPAGPATVLRLTSPTRLAVARVSDGRQLGVSVVAVLDGPWYQQLLQLVDQPIRAAAADLSFLGSYDRVVANSSFTRQWVRRLWAVDAGVLEPPVHPQPCGAKDPVILHVGRFFSPEAGHGKRQLELVEAFRRLHERGTATGWSLHLVGGCDDDGRPYLDTVRAAIGDLPVELHVNAPGDELRALFARASVYWHATGLGEDPEAHPERMEHFGIATVEAMSAGAVPVAIGVAGQLEVFDHGVEGFHFRDLDQLVSLTESLVADPDLTDRLRRAARQRAERYGPEAFRQRLLALVDEISG